MFGTIPDETPQLLNSHSVEYSIEIISEMFAAIVNNKITIKDNNCKCPFWQKRGMIRSFGACTSKFLLMRQAGKT